MTAEQSVEMSTYSLRRFFPSLADGLGLSPEERDRLGDWTAAGSSEPMRIRYSEAKLQSQARTRRLILSAVLHLGRHVHNPAHTDMRMMQQHMEKLNKRIETSHWGVRTTGISEVPPPPELEEEASYREKAPSSSSSSSSEDDSTDSSAADANQAEEDDSHVLGQWGTTDVQWVTPKHALGKLHLLRPETEDDKPIPFCKSKPFASDPITGVGLLSLADDYGARAWCPQCTAIGARASSFLKDTLAPGI